MSSTDDKDDPSFLALSFRLRYRIDSAFDSTASSGIPENSESCAGGFFVEGPESGSSRLAEDEHGGFIVEDYSPKPLDARSYIPLSEIPSALSLLDLSPDDDIMEVFENAASGWGAQDVHDDGVSRKDWRAVCAALLGEEGNDEENAIVDEDIEMGTDSSPESDEYQMGQQSSDTEQVSCDAYEQSTTRSKKAQKATKRTSADVSRQLTKSQKVQCRRDFGRFFPHLPDHQLDHQRITIKDVARVADLLKENLKAEEILDMVQAFSSSPDKSMNLADFEHMMIVTKLV